MSDQDMEMQFADLARWADEQAQKRSCAGWEMIRPCLGLDMLCWLIGMLFFTDRFRVV